MKQHKLTCKDVFKHICDNLDRDLNSPQCRDIKKHLAGCADCVTYLESLQSVVKLYKAYPVPRLSAASRKKLPALFK